RLGHRRLAGPPHPDDDARAEVEPLSATLLANGWIKVPDTLASALRPAPEVEAGRDVFQRSTRGGERVVEVVPDVGRRGGSQHLVVDVNPTRYRGESRARRPGGKKRPPVRWMARSARRMTSLTANRASLGSLDVAERAQLLLELGVASGGEGRWRGGRLP